MLTRWSIAVITSSWSTGLARRQSPSLLEMPLVCPINERTHDAHVVRMIRLGTEHDVTPTSTLSLNNSAYSGLSLSPSWIPLCPHNTLRAFPRFIPRLVSFPVCYLRSKCIHMACCSFSHRRPYEAFSDVNSRPTLPPHRSRPPHGTLWHSFLIMHRNDEHNSVSSCGHE